MGRRRITTNSDQPDTRPNRVVRTPLRSSISTSKLLVALVMTLSLIVAACGTGGEATDDDPADPTEPAADGGDDGDDGDPESDDDGESAASGGTLRVGVIDDPPHFDAFHITFGKMPYDMTFADTLGKFDQDFNFENRLAESWEIAEDNTSITITLRDDLVFLTGREVTAEDLVANVEKSLDPELGFTMLSYSVPVDFAEAVDDLTAVIHFNDPTPELAILDLLNFLPLLDLEAEYRDEPAGVGPFRLASWNPGVNLIAEKNEDYWDADNVHLDAIEFRMFDDKDAVAAAYNSDEIDFYFDVPARLAGTFDADEIQLGFPASWIRALIINSADPPFDNKLARQALWHAVDREAIAQSVFFGLVEPTVLFWPETSPAYDPDAFAQHSYDPDRALELFEEAGVNPEEITGEIVVSTSLEERPQMAQVIQQQLADIGINMEIVTHEHATWVERLLATDYTLTVAHSNGGAGHPAAIQAGSVTRLVNNATMAGGPAPQSYADAVLATMTAIGEEEMAAAAAQLREATLDEAFVQPMVGGDIMYVVKPFVHGLTTDSASQLLFRTVSIDQ